MAKVAALPAKGIISGFKGTLDFYIHDGQACVRRWPRSPGKKRSAAVEAQWPAFTYAARLWSTLSPEVQDSFRALSSGTGLSARDMAMRAYLSGLHRLPPGM